MPRRAGAEAPLGLGGQAELGVQGAVVAAGKRMRRGGGHRPARVDEDVVERKQGRAAAWLRSPRGDQAVADLARRVYVAEAQEPAELRVIEGGVVVARENHRKLA